MRNVLIVAALMAGSTMAVAQVAPADPMQAPLPVPQQQTAPDGVEPPADVTPAPLPDATTAPDATTTDPYAQPDAATQPDATMAPPSDTMAPDGTTPPMDDPSVPGEAVNEPMAG